MLRKGGPARVSQMLSGPRTARWPGLAARLSCSHFEAGVGPTVRDGVPRPSRVLLGTSADGPSC